MSETKITMCFVYEYKTRAETMYEAGQVRVPLARIAFKSNIVP